jgi:all-trans-retinol dehydrogenase (NAD+)
MRNFVGKRALVTGAGRGLGRELCQVFAAAQMEVVVTDCDPEGVSDTLHLLRTSRRRAVGYQMDVTDPESVRSIRDRLHAEHGPIDLLINNAGIVSGGEFLDVPLREHMATYHVNTIGLIVVTHTFLPDLLRPSGGHLVNIASASGLIGLPYGTTYASSKWAVIGFSDSIREELRQNGRKDVSVTTVCPGYVGTGMFEGVRSPWLVPVLEPPDVARQVLKAVRRDHEQVLTPWLIKLIPLGKGTMLRSWFRKLCHWLGVTTGMASWRGHAAGRREHQASPVGRPSAVSAHRAAVEFNPSGAGALELDGTLPFRPQSKRS